MRPVGVKPDNPPTRRHPLGQQIDDSTRSAAKIDRAVTRPQAHAVKQSRAIGRQLLSLTLQADALAAAAAQRVDSVRVIGGCRGRSWLYRGLTGHYTNSEIPPRSLLGRTAAYQRPSRHRPRRCGRVGTRDRPTAAEQSRRRGRRRRSSAAHPAAAEARRTLDVSVEKDDLGKRGGGLRGDARSVVEILRSGHLIGDDARSRSPGQGGPDSSELRASARRMLAPCRMDTGVALAEQSAPDLVSWMQDRLKYEEDGQGLPECRGRCGSGPARGDGDGEADGCYARWCW